MVSLGHLFVSLMDSHQRGLYGLHTCEEEDGLENPELQTWLRWAYSTRGRLVWSGECEPPTC